MNYLSYIKSALGIVYAFVILNISMCSPLLSCIIILIARIYVEKELRRLLIPLILYS